MQYNIDQNFIQVKFKYYKQNLNGSYFIKLLQRQIMEVTVKNCPITKTHISKMAYNRAYNILACNIENNDTISFFTLDNGMQFNEIFKNMAKPPGSKNSMSWSMDGKYLALGSGNIEIWQLQNQRIIPMHTYNENFIEIKMIQWNADSTGYAFGGISKSNTVKIRILQASKTKQIKLPDQATMSSISFDPFGKYLFILLRNNNLEIYNTSNLQKIKSVALSPNALKINPIRQVRVGAWSPDYSYFVIPSLDDSRLNISINLSRKQDFKVKNIFIGHCSAISCCSFNPKLYQFEGDFTRIVAMGDSGGNISIWRVGTTKTYPQPLLLSSSLKDSDEVVEEIQWDDKGQLLIVNMMKKYINLIRFSKQDFGLELTSDQIFNVIKQTYGTNRATDINSKQIQVFNGFMNNPLPQKQRNNYQNKINPQKLPSFHQQLAQNPLQLAQFPLQSAEIIQQLPKFQMQIQQKIIDSIQVQPPQSQIKNQQQSNLKINVLQKIQRNSNLMQLQNFQTTKMVVESRSNIVQDKSMILQGKQMLVQDKPIEVSKMRLLSQKTQYVKVSQQKTMVNKDNRKRIQPAILVRRQQVSGVTSNLKSNPLQNRLQGPAIPYFNNNLVQSLPRLQLPLISISEKFISLPNHRSIEIKRMPKIMVLQLIDLLDCRNVLSQRIFPSIVDFVQITHQYLYVINQQFLYIFDHELKPKDLPIKVGYIHKFQATSTGIVYYINCDGYLIGFNHLTNKCLTPAPVPIHVFFDNGKLNQANSFIKSNQNNSSMKSNQLGLTINVQELIIGLNQNVYLSIASNKTPKLKQIYFYDNKKICWIKTTIHQGRLTQGYSLKITDSQQIVSRQFYKIICPSLRQIQQKRNGIMTSKVSKTSSVVNFTQQQMIYYQKYEPNTLNYANSFIDHLKTLKKQNKNYQLRNIIYQHFFKNHKIQQDKNQLWERVRRQIGGHIVQEFLQIKFIPKINQIQSNQ